MKQLLFLNGLLGAFVFGIWAVDRVSFAWPVLVGMALFLLAASLVAIRRGNGAGKCFLLLFFVLGFMRCGQTDMLLPGNIGTYIGDDAFVRGEVAAEPQLQKLDADRVRVRYLVRAEAVTIQAEVIPANGMLYVYVQQSAETRLARVGDGICARGELKALHGYRNPGRVDTVAAARRQGIYASLHAGKAGAEIEVRAGAGIARWVQAVRLELKQRMTAVMGEGDSAAVFAMLFGGYEGIKPEVLEAFTATGIVHILSVSGSHVALLAATIAWFGNAVRLPRQLTAAVLLAVVILYTLLAGAVPPVLRAAAMGGLTFAAEALGRQAEAKRLLTVVALAMLFFVPRLIYDISFELSFAATAGLLYIAPLVREKLHSLPSALAGNLAITVGAQLSVLPFLAWYFNAVSLSSLLANCLAIPILECIIVLGLLAAGTGLLFPVLQTLLFAGCSLALGLAFEITRFIAKLPGGTLYLPPGNLAAAAAYYVLLGLLLSGRGAMFFRRRRRSFQQHLFSLGLVAGVLFYILVRPGSVTVHFIDVGQGDAALIITPHGRAVMVDTGGTRDSAFDIGSRVDLPYLRHYGIRQLDYLVLTHAHEDHAGGAGAILRGIPVGHVIIGREDRQAYGKAMRLNPETAAWIPAAPGLAFTVDGVRFVVLHAAAPENHGSNEASNVIRVSYGKHSWLFTGDLTGAEEEALAAAGTDLQSTVLKVAHHGSGTSSTAAFLAAVQPAWAVISVGADNPFGHPAPAVLERLHSRAIPVLRTDRQGAIVFTSDGQKIRAESFADGK